MSNKTKGRFYVVSKERERADKMKFRAKREPWSGDLTPKSWTINK